MELPAEMVQVQTARHLESAFPPVRHRIRLFLKIIARTNAQTVLIILMLLRVFVARVTLSVAAKVASRAAPTSALGHVDQSETDRRVSLNVPKGSGQTQTCLLAVSVRPLARRALM